MLGENLSTELKHFIFQAKSSSDLENGSKVTKTKLSLYLAQKGGNANLIINPLAKDVISFLEQTHI